MSYKQLTGGQRYQFEVLLREGFNKSQIARRTGKNKSTVCRELSRNRKEQGYCAGLAQTKTKARHFAKKKRGIPDETRFFVEYCLSLKWSPEQISGVGELAGYNVSHQWIYELIYEDKRAGGKLFKQLRHGHRKYKKGGSGKRTIIPNRVGIEHRPEVVETKERFGDWEVDTVLGKQGTGAIVSLVERKSKLYLVRKVSGKNARDVAQAMTDMPGPYTDSVKTITADNGTEFCNHEAVAEALKTDIYFANPYASWERGLNENFNGLLRQYIRKGTALKTVSDEALSSIEKQINLRPRKCLGFRQPAVVFDELLNAA